jgi:hypothetical protein
MCDLCNFTTRYTTNYNKHLSSKTHIIIFNKNEKIKSLRNINNKKRENKIITEINNIGEKIEKNINKKLEELEKNQKETNTGVRKITDYIDFLNTYCTGANPLQPLTKTDINRLLELDNYKIYEFEENMVKYIKNNRLHLKLGNIILSKFLKSDDLTTQQVWTSDVSRLIYLILRMFGKQKNWVRDKKGEIFSELIIIPIIERLNELMTDYAHYCIQQFNKIGNYDENAILLDNAQTAKDSTVKFYNDYIKKEILKFMASKLSISSKSDEIFELCS